MYERITYEDILERMLDRVPEDIDKREGSVIYDALASAAVELQLMYIELDVVLRETFADTASRENLLRRAAERGITPKKAVKAVLKAEITPEALDIPIGSRFSCNSLTYRVLEKVGNGVYQIECETEGTAGNRVFGKLIPIEYIDGLEKAELKELWIPGEEEEGTESVREKYFASFRSQAFGGNKQDYMDKACNIQGVGAVRVTPVWDGAGTVKLTILDTQYRAASEHLLDQVQQIIDPTKDGNGTGIAPIGHVVTIDTPTEFPVSVRAAIVFDTGYSFETLRSQITEALDQYLAEVRKEWPQKDTMVIRIAQIESRLLGITGILDISATLLNGQSENLILEETHIPVCGEVST